MRRAQCVRDHLRRHARVVTRCAPLLVLVDLRQRRMGGRNVGHHDLGIVRQDQHRLLDTITPIRRANFAASTFGLPCT